MTECWASKPVVQLQAAYRGSRARAQVSQQQESYRHAWMRYYLRARDIDAAVAIGYLFSDCAEFRCVGFDGRVAAG
jgi:hypothetical protein